MIHFESTDYGYHYGAVREPTADADKLDYVRVTEYVAPYYCMNPPDRGTKSAGFFFVPIDDYNTMLYQVSASELDEQPIDRNTARLQMSMLARRGPRRGLPTAAKRAQQLRPEPRAHAEGRLPERR